MKNVGLNTFTFTTFQKQPKIAHIFNVHLLKKSLSSGFTANVADKTLNMH